ncbi:MAG TPA: extracellular solute-binding protein [Mycobacteriales bacterium]|nr:extracellular solute-binding protein [Mycobacteriales bacterium]
MPDITRRRFIRTGLTAAAITATGPVALSACSNKGRGGITARSGARVTLPQYVRYQGVTPDFRGKDGVDDATTAYPGNPPRATNGKPGDGSDVTALAMTNTPVPPGVNNNAFWQELNRRLGFDLKIQLVPSGDFPQRFQTAVAGDKLPDMFAMFLNAIPSMPSMLEQKATDLTKQLSGEAVRKYPLLANIPTASWKLSTYGGRIYGVPIPRGAQSSWVLYSRRDMLEQQGIAAEPESLKDFESLCRQLTAGRSNIWALGRLPMSWIRQAYGIGNGWSLKGGKLVSALEDERQKDALETGRRLITSGVVHPDSFDATSTARKTWMAGDTIWLIDDTFSGWQGFYLYPVSKSFRLQTWAPPAIDGGRAPIWLGSPTYSITVINARAADRVDALLSVLNYLAAPFGTEEYLFNHFGVKDVDYVLRGTNPVLTTKGKSETQLGLQYLGQGPWVTYIQGHPEVTKDAFEAQSRLVPAAVPDPTLGLYSETDVRRGAQISIADVENDILQGREPVSKWDSAVAEWKSKGGDRIRSEYQKALDDGH